MKKLFIELLKRPVAFQPVIAKAFDSINLAILWCQLYYWMDKSTDDEGWIYKTREEIFEETALSRKQQETAKKDGMALGVIEIIRKGKLGVNHFRINLEKTQEVIEKYAETLPEKQARGQAQIFAPVKKVRPKKEEIPLEQQIEPYRNKYSPAMLEDFINHYTQVTDSGLQLWQKIKAKGAFQVANRLVTWRKRDEHFAFQASQRKALKQVDERPVHRDEKREAVVRDDEGFSAMGDLMKARNYD